MCRGLAVGYNVETKKMICKGLSSHTKTLENQEDKCVKLEIIINDGFKRGYLVDLDAQYKNDKTVKRKFKKYINMSGSFTKYFNDIIENWIDNNEKDILRWLLTNRSYTVTKGNTDNSYQKTGGSTDNSSQETKGNTNNSYQETKGDIYINSIKNYNKTIDSFIEKLTKKHNNKLTWKHLVELAIKGYEIDRRI